MIKDKHNILKYLCFIIAMYVCASIQLCIRISVFLVILQDRILIFVELFIGHAV